MSAPFRAPASQPLGSPRPSPFGAAARVCQPLPGRLHSVTVWGDGSGPEAVVIIADCPQSNGGTSLEIVTDCGGPLGALAIDDGAAAPEDAVSLASPVHNGDTVVLADGLYDGDTAIVRGVKYGPAGGYEAFVGGRLGGQWKGVWRKITALRRPAEPAPAALQPSLF